MPSLIRKLFPRFTFRRRYRKGQDSWGVHPQPQQLVDVLDRLSPGRALDLGCGRGYNAIAMAERGWETTGVDFSPEAVRSAREKAAEKGLAIDFRVGDVTRPDVLDRSFDLIIDIGCYHSLGQRKRPAYRANLMRLLADGGTYFLYATHKPIEQQPPGITEDDIEIFSKNLSLVHRGDAVNKWGRPGYWLTFTRTPGKIG